MIKSRDDVVREIAQHAGLSIRESDGAVEAFIRVVTKTLVAGDTVQLLGFGTFEVKDRAPRVGRNMKTDKPVPIPAKRAPVFKAGSRLKAAVEAGE